MARTNTGGRRPSQHRRDRAASRVLRARCSRQADGKGSRTVVVEGQDWFTLAGASALSWAAIVETIEREQRHLIDTIATLKPADSGGSAAAERLDLVLGITCHAVYHAGQVQLLKKLAEERRSS